MNSSSSSGCLFDPLDAFSVLPCTSGCFFTLSHFTEEELEPVRSSSFCRCCSSGLARRSSRLTRYLWRRQCKAKHKAADVSPLVLNEGAEASNAVAYPLLSPSEIKASVMMEESACKNVSMKEVVEEERWKNRTSQIRVVVRKRVRWMEEDTLHSLRPIAHRIDALQTTVVLAWRRHALGHHYHVVLQDNNSRWRPSDEASPFLKAESPEREEGKDQRRTKRQPWTLCSEEVAAAMLSARLMPYWGVHDSDVEPDAAVANAHQHHEHEWLLFPCEGSLVELWKGEGGNSVSRKPLECNNSYLRCNDAKHITLQERQSRTPTLTLSDTLPQLAKAVLTALRTLHCLAHMAHGDVSVRNILWVNPHLGKRGTNHDFSYLSETKEPNSGTCCKRNHSSLIFVLGDLESLEPLLPEDDSSATLEHSESFCTEEKCSEKPQDQHNRYHQCFSNIGVEVATEFETLPSAALNELPCIGDSTTRLEVRDVDPSFSAEHVLRLRQALLSQQPLPFHAGTPLRACEGLWRRALPSFQGSWLYAPLERLIGEGEALARRSCPTTGKKCFASHQKSAGEPGCCWAACAPAAKADIWSLGIVLLQWHSAVQSAKKRNDGDRMKEVAEWKAQHPVSHSGALEPVQDFHCGDDEAKKCNENLLSPLLSCDCSAADEGDDHQASGDGGSLEYHPLQPVLRLLRSSEAVLDSEVIAEMPKITELDCLYVLEAYHAAVQQASESTVTTAATALDGGAEQQQGKDSNTIAATKDPYEGTRKVLRQLLNSSPTQSSVLFPDECHSRGTQHTERPEERRNGSKGSSSLSTELEATESGTTTTPSSSRSEKVGVRVPHHHHSRRCSRTLTDAVRDAGEDFVDFLAHCLHPDPKYRYTARKLLEMPWLSDETKGAASQ